MDKEDINHDIKSLGSEQLGLYYEITEQKLNNLQIEIINEITELLGQFPTTNDEIYTDIDKFETYCTTYWTHIESQKKELFMILKKEYQEIQKEIINRQMKLLKEIGITTPSQRVLEIMHELRGICFQAFEEIINFIKLTQNHQTHKRPKNKKILLPNELIKKFEKHGGVITIIAKNLGPCAN